MESYTFSRVLGPIPNLRLFKPHDNCSIDRFVEEKRKSPFNHDFHGFSQHENVTSLVPYFRHLNQSVVVGHGRSDFYRASKIMSNFLAVNSLPWANIVTHSDTAEGTYSRISTTICTLIRCYGFTWTLNPCRVVYSSVNSNQYVNNLLTNQIAYSTLHGHLIAGEERFRVVLMDNDDVVFSLYSFTRGAGLIGSVAMPFIRPIQSRFFHDVTESMRQLMIINT